MTTPGALIPLTSASFKRSADVVSGIEKSNAKRQFQGEYSNAREENLPRAGDASPRRTCQIGTDPHASFWNGPRLRPAFVAQVLGQVMAGGDMPDASAGAVYRRRALRLAASFDESV